MESKSPIHTRGILNPQLARQKFILARHWPAPELRPYILHYWTVTWNMEGQPSYRQDILSHPNVNLAIQSKLSGIFGINRGRDSRILEGSGTVFGVKFQSAGFYPFWKQNLSQLTEKSICISEVFQCDPRKLEQLILTGDNVQNSVPYMDHFLLSHLPSPDPLTPMINSWIDRIREDRTILKAKDLEQLTGMSLRSLQRLFDRYVGVSPKWVIQRYRLHEAAERLSGEPSPDWLQLSLELGYYDQSHFIRDFKALLGCSPQVYSEMNRAGTTGRAEDS